VRADASHGRASGGEGTSSSATAKGANPPEGGRAVAEAAVATPARVSAATGARGGGSGNGGGGGGGSGAAGVLKTQPSTDGGGGRVAELVEGTSATKGRRVGHVPPRQELPEEKARRRLGQEKMERGLKAKVRLEDATSTKPLTFASSPLSISTKSAHARAGATQARRLEEWQQTAANDPSGKVPSIETTITLLLTECKRLVSDGKRDELLALEEQFRGHPLIGTDGILKQLCNELKRVLGREIVREAFTNLVPDIRDRLEPRARRSWYDDHGNPRDLTDRQRSEGSPEQDLTC